MSHSQRILALERQVGRLVAIVAQLSAQQRPQRRNAKSNSLTPSDVARFRAELAVRGVAEDEDSNVIDVKHGRKP